MESLRLAIVRIQYASRKLGLDFWFEFPAAGYRFDKQRSSLSVSREHQRSGKLCPLTHIQRPLKIARQQIERAIFETFKMFFSCLRLEISLPARELKCRQGKRVINWISRINSCARKGRVLFSWSMIVRRNGLLPHVQI